MESQSRRQIAQGYRRESKGRFGVQLAAIVSMKKI
jgi:hypothetical protein